MWRLSGKKRKQPNPARERRAGNEETFLARGGGYTNKKVNTKKEPYDIAIVGGGVTGAALLFVLARYTDVQKIVLLEKNSTPGQVNSRSNNNSQTLHLGDIETNYSLKKAAEVKRRAMMVVNYAKLFGEEESKKFLHTVSKMVLAVGVEEVKKLNERYENFRGLFPSLKKYSRGDIASLEPKVTEGRDEKTPILALGTEKGYAVNFGALAESLISNAQKESADRVTILFNIKVNDTARGADGLYVLATDDGEIRARAVIFATDAWSILYAKRLGYAKEYSIIPISGNFYFAPETLRGKVYTLQDEKLPFAAVHGDPDVSVPGKTRFGPTAKISPMFESGSWSTVLDYFRAASLDFRTIKSFIKILSDRHRVSFLLKNLAFSVPFFGKRLFLKSVQKIVPTMRANDLTFAEGFGGMRMQTVNKKTGELELGEKKIIGESVIFNSAPSPGASICLGNAEADAKTIMSFFKGEFSFNENRFGVELG